MAKVIEKRPDGTAIVVVPATDAAELKVGGPVDVRPVGAAEELPWPASTRRLRSRRSRPPGAKR